MKPQTLCRLTQTGLGWYRKNRVLNRKRTSSQKYSRCIWEVVLGRLALGPSDFKTLFETFLVDGHSPWYAEAEIAEQVALLLEMGYVSHAESPELDALCRERSAHETKLIKECGRDWKRRNERMKALDEESLRQLDDWFRMHPNWPS